MLILGRTSAKSSTGCPPRAGSWTAVGSAQAADALLLVVQRALVIAFATAMVRDVYSGSVVGQLTRG